MSIAKQIEQANKLIASKQNQENAMYLIGIDASGNEHFIDWLSKEAVLHLPSNMADIAVRAGRKD